MIDATRIAVPLAESQLKTKTAGSAVVCATTGGTRSTILSSPGMATRGAEIASSRAFTLGRPQRKTITDNTIQGIHGDGPVLAGVAGAFAAPMPPRQTRRKAVRHAIDVSDATMSTSHG